MRLKAMKPGDRKALIIPQIIRAQKKKDQQLNETQKSQVLNKDEAETKSTG